MKWFGNTLREPGNNITFSVLEWNLQGSRGRGCPKQSRRHTFQDELDKYNITWREAERTTKNRMPCTPQQKQRWSNFIYCQKTSMVFSDKKEISARRGTLELY